MRQHCDIPSKTDEVTATLSGNIREIGPFDIVIEWLLVALLAFMPLAFGVVHAWSEEVVIVVVGVIVFCFLLKLILHRHQGATWTWAYIPLGIFLLIPLFQLLPLPASFVGIISPGIATLKKELLSDLPNANIILKSMTLSFYPYATRHSLRLVLAVAAVFIVVLNSFQRPVQIKRLLMAIALIGGIIAALTIAQNLFGNGKIYWFVSSQHCKGYSGPFVNHSNYGQFMNLSIGAALGLLLVKLHEDFQTKKITTPVVFEYLSSSRAHSFWLLVIVIGLGSTSVFISLTRGGMVSLLTAIFITTLLIASRRPLKGNTWIIVAMALIAFTCVLFVGFDAIYDRLATLRDFDKVEGGRIQILKDIAIAWTKFPIFGVGFGTHPVVYPMFDRSTIAALALHAENEYAQVIEETGLLGLVSLIVFGIIIGANYLRSIRKTDLPIYRAAYGLGFGLLAILINSLSDFGQHLPANAILSAILCALLLVLGRQSKDRSSPTQTVASFGKSKALYTLAFLAVFGVWVWAFIGANNLRIAEGRWKKAVKIERGLAKSNWQGTDAEYANLISHAATASNYQPENIKYRYWLNVYRWRSVKQMTDPETGETIIPKDLMPRVHDIVDELHKVRILCPTYGPAYSTVGEIEKFVLYNDDGADRIKKGFRLAPCDPITCYVAGYLDATEGNVKDCVKKFKRALQLDKRLFKKIVDIYVNHLSRPDLAMSLAGEKISRLSYVAKVLEDMQYDDLVGQIRKKIKFLLEARCSQSNPPAWAFASLAKIYKEQGKCDTAIEYYHQALVLDYACISWRLELAKLLAGEEMIQEAMHEAKICLQLSPQLNAAKKLVADISVHPASFGEEIESP